MLLCREKAERAIRAIEFYSGIGVYRSRVFFLGFIRLLRRFTSRAPSQRRSRRNCCRRLRLGPDRMPSVRCKPRYECHPQGQSTPSGAPTPGYGWPDAKQTDITTLTAADLSRLNADLWLLSPSCQPYTVLNPLAKGAADPRAQSFLHLIDDVLPELSAHDMHPRYLLVENVAGFQVRERGERLASTF